MIKDKSIYIKNVYYMLSYAFKTLEQREYSHIALEDFDHVHDLLAAILSKGIGRQLKQGLFRDYINRKEDLTVLRGKIDMPGTIRLRMNRTQRLACEYDELSENNLLNQILKATVMLLVRHGEVKAEYKNALKKEMLFFADVDFIDVTQIRWSQVRFQRNNSTYRMLISLCKMVIEGMILTTESGEVKLASFFDEQHMYRLYEKFILEYYRKEHPELHANPDTLHWQLDDEVDDFLPAMITDITLKKGEKILIIDAKYYGRTLASNQGSLMAHSANLYQIFAYVKNKDEELRRAGKPHEVSGMLLYAGTDEAVQPNHTYQMSGNAITVRTLDLGREFGEIREQLEGIANLITLSEFNYHIG